MANSFKALLPSSVSKRYGVFAGTNRYSETLIALKSFFRGDFANTSDIQDYERKFAAATGSQHAFAFGAGRMALYAALQALELKPGDEVILPAFTCVVVPNALIYAGLVPVYADIDAHTFNLDPSQIEKHLTPRTRALYLQSTFGLISGYSQIRAIAERHQLLLIEDAAHSLGARTDGKPSGSLGDVAFFSTDHSKVINTVVGGMVTTSRKDVASRLRAIQAQTPRLSSSIVRRLLFTFVVEQVFFSNVLLWIGEPLSRVFGKLKWHFFFSDEMSVSLPQRNYPYPCQLPSPLALIGSSQLDQLSSNLDHRRKIAAECESILRANPQLSAEKFQNSAWLRYSFVVEDREKFESFMSDRFTLGTWFTSVVHGRNTDLEAVGYQSGSCPIAERIARTIVNVPTHPRIQSKTLMRKLREYAQKMRPLN